MEDRRDVSLAEVAEGIRRTDEMFAFLGEYDYNAEIAALKAELATTATAMLSIGCRLLRMKEHEAHGRFVDAVRSIGLEMRSAYRFMNAAMKFVSADTGKVKYPQLVQQNVSKIYELTLLDDEELEALEGGGSVSDITIEEVDRLSVRELRRKLRDGKAEVKALEDQLVAKNSKIDELEREMRTMESRQPFSTREALEGMLRSWNDEITGFVADGSLISSKAVAIAERMCDVMTDDRDGNAAVRASFKSLRSSLDAVLEELERAGEEIQGMLPDAFRVSSGFRSLDEGGVD